jgi:hypothetical protein
MGFLGDIAGAIFGGDKTTQTNRISEEDANAIRGIRDAGQTTADAAMAGPWATGANPYTQQGMDRLGQLYGAADMSRRWGQDYGRNALNFASQTGLQGMGDYMNPMLSQYFAGMDPMYARAYEQAGTTAAQNATRQGAFGGSRSAIMEGQMRGDVQRNQMADYGRYQAMAGQDAIRAMLGERQFQGQLGQNMLNFSQNALNQQGMFNQQRMAGGDYLRRVQMEQNMDPYTRAAAAQNAKMSAYGKDIENSSTTQTQQSPFNQMLNLAATAAQFMPGGGGGGGGAPAPPTIAPAPLNHFSAPLGFANTGSGQGWAQYGPPPGYQPQPGGF